LGIYVVIQGSELAKERSEAFLFKMFVVSQDVRQAFAPHPLMGCCKKRKTFSQDFVSGEDRNVRQLCCCEF
jgi:hypothetical protein